ncbi:hypothetical protein, no similarity [Maudiozyma saulgeensis]|uniref:Protein BIG1 n=1 Tax=Maudiozyma saulgeensis TaxID=1789683 RepID=A0A1X7R3I2_9SACH|nr:hypothetical protein, no similarity [Kazachstania saulgeensis]
MKLLLVWNLFIFATLLVNASNHIISDTREVVKTPRDLFYDIVNIFREVRKIQKHAYMDDLFALREEIDFDEECKEILSDIISTRDRVTNLNGDKKKGRRIRTKTLEKCVETYINHQIHDANNSNKEKLRKTLFALRAQEVTMSMVTEKSLRSILKHIKFKLDEYGLVNNRKKGSSNDFETEQEEDFIENTLVVFSKGIFGLGICILFGTTICLTALGSLMFVQVILWMLILVRFLTISN